MNYQSDVFYYDLGYRFVILGDSNTGKSTLLSKLFDDVKSNYLTSGTDFRSTCITINDKKCKLHLWDTSGKLDYRELITSFIKNRDGIILCFNLADPETFLNLDNWKTIIDTHKSAHTQVILVGVKNDLVREVAFEQGQKYAMDNNWEYTEISCIINSKNIICDKIFVSLAKKIYRMYPSLETNLIAKPPVIISDSEPQKSTIYDYTIEHPKNSYFNCNIL
jgi:small GTP-binding protein